MGNPAWLSATAALDLIPRGARIVCPPGMGEPTTLTAALPEVAAGRNWTLCSGLLLGSYAFLPAVDSGDLAYETWQATPRISDRLAAGVIGFVPAQASGVPAMLRGWAPGAAVVRVSPPDRDGWCSLGTSTSYGSAAVQAASVAIAEVDAAVPRTRGDSMVNVSSFDALTESTVPIATHVAAPTSATADRVTDKVLGLLPEHPTLQIGVGQVPEGLVRRLADAAVRRVRFVGLVTDDMIALSDSGLIQTDVVHGLPPIVSPEMHGSSRLLEWCDDNPLVGAFPSQVAHDAGRLARLPRFTSVNSALEVDLMGNVNGEIRGGQRVSGTGGSLDYMEAAGRSDGGQRVIALASCSPHGSRIVPRVAWVTAPGSMVDVVVTEHGVARLQGQTIAQRASALIAVADPRYRDALQSRVDAAMSGRGETSY